MGNTVGHRKALCASFDCCQWQVRRITRTERETARLMDRLAGAQAGTGKLKMKSNAQDLLQIRGGSNSSSFGAALGGATMQFKVKNELHMLLAILFATTDKRGKRLHNWAGRQEGGSEAVQHVAAANVANAALVQHAVAAAVAALGIRLIFWPCNLS